MPNVRPVLVLRADGLVLGAEALTEGADPVVVRWTPDASHLHDEPAAPPVSAVIPRPSATSAK